MKRVLAAVIAFAVSLPLFAADKKAEVADAVKLLKSKKLAERTKGIEDLAKLGEDAKPASFDLMEVMVSQYPTGRDKFLETLEKIDPAIYKHVVTLLTDRDADNHDLAIKSLKVGGKDSIGSLPVLTAILKVDRRNQSIVVYQSTQKGILEALPDIAPEHALTRQAVVTVIGSGPNTLQHGSCLDAIQVAKALRLEAKTVLPPLLIAINDPNIRARVAETIGEYGPDAKAALTTLMKFKLDSDKEVRDAVAAAIEKIKG